MLELTFLEGSRRGESIRLTFDKAWFGRQSTCDFVLDGEGISRAHFFIERRGEDYILVDNKSTNGTFVNRVKSTAVTLRPGFHIAAGSCEMQVREADLAQDHAFRFVVERIGEGGGTQVIDNVSLLVGRKSICQVLLNDPAVSAIHAEIALREGVPWITDQSSGAGVYVNGQRVVSQALGSGDVITIKPFEITVTLAPQKCSLDIRDRQPDPGQTQAVVPPAYQEVAVAPRAESGAAKPSAQISASPNWMQEKAPIWVPTLDITPNRFRSATVIGLLVAVTAGGTYVLASHQGAVFSPGPLIEAHAAFECASCHTGLATVANASCKGCHTDVQSAKHLAGEAHARLALSCIACHTEHHGAKFDIARQVGASCQAAGCHTVVHEKVKFQLASAPAPVLTSATPRAVAFEARFLNFGEHPDDPLHGKHLAALNGECTSCHTNGDPSIKVAREPMRARCLACHGFGPEATLRDRCYSCHMEHATNPPEKILTRLKFDEAPKPQATPTSLASGAWPTSLMLLGALAGVPLLYFCYLALASRLRIRRFESQVESQLAAGPVVPFRAADAALAAPAAGKLATPAQNQAPGGNQRPVISLDLCVGCAACVHVCPFNVLEIVNEKAIAARLDDCTGFAACVVECPTEAIRLVDSGPMQTVELPVYGVDLETNVPGLYLAGEVTGKALIKIAINQGKQVVESILKRRPEPGPEFDVIVVGAGPAGTSAGLAAVQAGLKVKVLDQGTMANTIRNYPRQKFVMAEPVMIPLYGPLWMEDTSKEALLENWLRIVESTGLVVNEDEKVLQVVQSQAAGNGSLFSVKTIKGEYRSSRVILAIGKRGSPRKLSVPGENSAKVAYNLLDAEAYRGRTICIVGGGDSGIEAANGLARPELENRVWLIHRDPNFGRAKPRNQKKIQNHMDNGRIKAYFSAAVQEIGEATVSVKTAEGTIEEIPNDFVFVMVGGENPKKFLADAGIEFSQRALG